MDEKTYSSLEFAEICESNHRTVLLWAKNHGVHYVGTGRRKVYIFKESDKERFKNREKPGRRWH
jgi:hypothetical protein